MVIWNSEYSHCCFGLMLQQNKTWCWNSSSTVQLVMTFNRWQSVWLLSVQSYFEADILRPNASISWCLLTLCNVLLWQEMGSAAEVGVEHIRMFSYLLSLTNAIQWAIFYTHCSTVRHQCFHEISKWLPFSRTHPRRTRSQFSVILRSKWERRRNHKVRKTVQGQPPRHLSICLSSGLVSTKVQRSIAKSFQMVCLVSQRGAHTFACTCEFNLHQCVAASDSQQRWDVVQITQR